MTCRIENVGTLAYRFCPESVPTAADRVRAVFSVHLIDEITGEPMDIDVGLTTTVDGLFNRVAHGSVVGLVGKPAGLFPKLGSNPVSLSMEATAARYLPLRLIGQLGPIGGFPGQFAPLDLGDRFMHRVSTTLRGRTVRKASLNPVVVSGATVKFVGYWSSMPPAHVNPNTVMAAPNLIALAPPFYANRKDGLTLLRRRDVVPVIGQQETLLLPAVAGETQIRLSNRNGLAAGGLLIIEGSAIARSERILIKSVDTRFAADQPAWVTLVHPLAYTHLDGASC